MTINQLQDELIEEFSELEWVDRYQMIIDYGKDLKPCRRYAPSKT